SSCETGFGTSPPGGGFPQGGGDVPNPVSQDESKAADELGKMAPIPPAPKPAKVGDIITRFTVTWEVEIGKPPEASAENKS
ncbi:MAG TPA: hypothetical protein PK308_11525, partial [Phycisphaerales bacterium]|nr:hypothetical protein [Phycisphaerales bacterium]